MQRGGQSLQEILTLVWKQEHKLHIIIIFLMTKITAEGSWTDNNPMPSFTDVSTMNRCFRWAEIWKCEFLKGNQSPKYKTEHVPT